MTQTGSVVIDYKDPQISPLLTESIKNPTPFRLRVQFAEAFASPPAVMLGLSGFEGGADWFRFWAEVVEVTDRDFHIRYTTRRSWIDRVKLSWIAIGDSIPKRNSEHI